MTTIFKNITSKLALVLLSAVVLNGCHKKDTLGSSVCPSAAFKVTTPFSLNLTSVNPATDKLTMVAGFTEEIEWWITIKGVSGAIKKYTGKSDSINIDYYGNSETDKFFEAEACEVKFELGCGKEGGATKNFTYTSVPTMHNTNFGLLLNDFDGKPAVGAYSTSGGWGNDANKEVIKVNNITVDASPQGGKAMMYYGIAKDSISVPQIKLWYYGGFSSSIATQITTLKNTYGVTDPERLYLNMYVRGYHTDYPNTQLQLSLEGLKESVDNGSPVAEFKNYNLNLDWDGWKMVSIKFSEFVNLHAFPSTYNTVTNSNITNLGFGLGAGPEQNNKAKALLDFLIITVDAPYKEVQKRNY